MTLQIARDCNVAELDKAMENGVTDHQLNELDEKKNSPLHYAVRYMY